MIGPLQTLSIPLPPADLREILRYAGAKQADSALLSLLEEAIAEVQPLLTPKLCFRMLPVEMDGCDLNLGFTAVRSEKLSQALVGCSQAVVFSATLGFGPDRLIARYGRIAPSRALLMQAIGAERIEALCDCFCRELEQQSQDKGLHITRRFSPGYGDLPLSFQKDIFRILDCPRSIGLSLNESLLMSPSKSVTAIVGIGPGCQSHPGHSCSHCEKTDCIHRRTL